MRLRSQQSLSPFTVPPETFPIMRFGVFPVMVGRAAAGPETYEHRLLKAMAAIDQHNEHHIFCVDQQAVRALDIHQPNVFHHVLWPNNRWVSMSVSLPLAIRKAGIKVLHATFAPPLWSPVDYVFTMHGGVTFSHPHFYPPTVVLRLNTLIKRGLSQAKLILCVSDFVKQEIAERFNIPDERLRTVYHGVGPEFRPLPAEEVGPLLMHRHGLSGPYVLFVGKLHSNKNIVRLIEAFHQATNEAGRPDVQLVLVGRKFWGSEGIDEMIDRLGMRTRVRLLGHQPQDHLAALYNGALGLVFPSLWEGFGLPVIEAMACGTPVVASDIACLPEVTSGAALLVDPYRTERLAEGIHRLVIDEDMRSTLRLRGLARAQHFDWHHTARRTLDAYHSAA